MNYTFPLTLLVAIVVAGCNGQTMSKNANYANHSYPSDKRYYDLNLATADAGKQLSQSIKQEKPSNNIETPKLNVVLVSSFVELDSLNSSTFGRTVSEQVAASLTNNGLNAKEVKLSDSLQIKKDGEFILGREAKKIALQNNADLVLTGTYTEAVDAVYVTSRLIDVAQNIVLSANNFTIEKDANIASMLHGVRGKDIYPVEDGAGTAGEKSLMQTIQEYDQNTNVKRKKFQYK